MDQTNAKRKLRGVIVGTGRAGTDLHYGAFASVGAEIQAFVDVDAAKARAAAESCKVPAFYTSLEAALQEKGIDFVSICTGLPSHYSLACQALDAGCHVLVEKPFTESLDQAVALKKQAEEKKRHLSVIHNRRFFPAMQKAVEMLRTGQIGEVIHVDRQMHSNRDTVRMMEPEHWAQRIPGGRLFEANPHNLYLLYQFLGPMRLRSIHGSRRTERWPHALIDGFTATLEGQAGATAQITMSLSGEKRPPQYLMVIGTCGTLYVDSRHCVLVDDLLGSAKQPSPKAAAKILVRHLLAKGRQVLGKAAGGKARPPASSSPIHPSSWEHKFQIEKFIGYIEGRETQPAVSWEEILETQRLNEEMGRAIMAPPRG